MRQATSCSPTFCVWCRRSFRRITQKTKSEKHSEFLTVWVRFPSCWFMKVCCIRNILLLTSVSMNESRIWELNMFVWKIIWICPLGWKWIHQSSWTSRRHAGNSIKKIAGFEKLENLSSIFQNALAFLGRIGKVSLSEFPEIYD